MSLAQKDLKYATERGSMKTKDLYDEWLFRAMVDGAKLARRYANQDNQLLALQLCTRKQHSEDMKCVVDPL